MANDEALSISSPSGYPVAEFVEHIGQSHPD